MSPGVDSSQTPDEDVTSDHAFSAALLQSQRLQTVSQWFCSDAAARG